MKFLGVWVPHLNESTLHKCYRIIMMLLQYLFLIFQIIYIIQVWGDLEAVSQASYLLFTQACLCLKVTVFQVNISMVRELLKQMNGDIFKPLCEEHVRFTRLVEDAFHTFLFFQLIGSVGLICMSALRILVVDWRSLQFASIVTYLSVMISQLFSEDLHTVLYKCAWYEQDLKFKRALCFVMMRMSRPIVVKAGHYVPLSRQTFVSVDWRSLQFASIVTYLSVMISQLFVCCWCGHELTATSENLHTVLYKCAWYEQDVKFKRALCLVMMRMSKPIVVKAGHYVPLSRQTFVSILRMSYSYFAVLNQRK
ncbi:Odorant receptor 2a [Papilio machaon]|uniref:Odorant receptor 2a n=1 Tax=Papilio machaon TaxID=76193 RepID=A0A0N1IFP6_PAPMA|nr:Odorant receptor 2a [Papilio machaon]